MISIIHTNNINNFNKSERISNNIVLKNQGYYKTDSFTKSTDFNTIKRSKLNFTSGSTIEPRENVYAQERIEALDKKIFDIKFKNGKSTAEVIPLKYEISRLYETHLSDMLKSQNNYYELLKIMVKLNLQDDEKFVQYIDDLIRVLKQEAEEWSEGDHIRADRENHIALYEAYKEAILSTNKQERHNIKLPELDNLTCYMKGAKNEAKRLERAGLGPVRTLDEILEKQAGIANIIDINKYLKKIFRTETFEDVKSPHYSKKVIPPMSAIAKIQKDIGEIKEAEDTFSILFDSFLHHKQHLNPEIIDFISDFEEVLRKNITTEDSLVNNLRRIARESLVKYKIALGMYNTNDKQLMEGYIKKIIEDNQLDKSGKYMPDMCKIVFSKNSPEQKVLLIAEQFAKVTDGLLGQMRKYKFQLLLK